MWEIYPGTSVSLFLVVSVCDHLIVFRLVDVRSLSFPLYGALDCLDLLLLRGGRVVNWNDKCEVSPRLTPID